MAAPPKPPRPTDEYPILAVLARVALAVARREIEAEREAERKRKDAA